MYKVTVDHNSKSGNNPKKWEYFQVLHIFKTYFYVKTYACCYICGIYQQDISVVYQRLQILIQKLYLIVEIKYNVLSLSLLQIMQELFADKPWVQPLAVAGSHVDENVNEEEKDNDPSRKCQFKYTLYVYVK